MRLSRCIRRDWRLLGLLLLAINGCASAPVQEMSDARQAVAAAEEAGAPAKAPDAYVKAKAHIEHAESALLNGDYRNAREHATWAKTHALEARQRALGQQGEPSHLLK
jgi:hypothetical protein